MYPLYANHRKNYFNRFVIVLCLLLLCTLLPTAQGSARADSLEILIYEKKDYDAALEMCKKRIAEKERNAEYSLRREKDYASLIKNYSDHDRKPLELYFEAAKQRNEPKEQANLYRRLLAEYPNCKLAGFVQYLVAENYRRFVRSRGEYLDRSAASERAVESYRAVVERYPRSVFPISGQGPRQSRMGAKIAPFALLDMGELLEDVDYDPYKALEAYQQLIQLYPNADDGDGRNLVVSAYVNMLYIYRDNGRPIATDSTKAKGVCRILLNEYPNQEFLIKRESLGQSHPTALMVLAEMEPDTGGAIALYRRVLRDFPNAWGGKWGSGGVALYSTGSLQAIADLLNDPERMIAECRDIIGSIPHKTVAGWAQFVIAHTYHHDLKDNETARTEYQKVIDDYEDVVVDPESGTIGDWAREAIAALSRDLGKE